MNLASEWKLVFDPSGAPRVLVDHGWEIDGELAIELQKACAVTPIIEADPFLEPEDSALYQFSVRVYNYTTLDTDSRIAMMEALRAVAALGKQPLRLSVRGRADVYYQWANCYIRSFASIMDMDAPVSGYVLRHDILATGLSLVYV